MKKHLQINKENLSIETNQSTKTKSGLNQDEMR